MTVIYYKLLTPLTQMSPLKQTADQVESLAGALMRMHDPWVLVDARPWSECRKSGCMKVVLLTCKLIDAININGLWG